MNKFETIYGKKLEGPAFIENESDFYKVLISMVKIMSKGDYDDAEFFTMGMRIICHEYLALVLAGKMDPFTLPKEFVEREKETFKDLINFENVMLQKAGVPMFEGEHGKVEIDVKEMKRRANGKT